MEIKDFTTAQLIKKLRKLAREMRLESCMYVTADIMDEAANRLEERVKDSVQTEETRSD